MMRLLLVFWGPRQNNFGMELAGQIEAVGQAVSSFKVGDAVFASTTTNFGA